MKDCPCKYLNDTESLAACGIKELGTNLLITLDDMDLGAKCEGWEHSVCIQPAGGLLDGPDNFYI